MRRALIAFTFALMLGLSLATPASGSGVRYHCSPRGLGGLDAYTWVHSYDGGARRWTRPQATLVRGRYVFGWFTFDGGYGRGYERPWYAWAFGYWHRITAHWDTNRHTFVSCTMWVV